MKKIISLILLFAILSCKKIKTNTNMANSERCITLKKNIENHYKEQNYSESIKLFKSYKDCYLELNRYQIALAILYKKNRQDSKSNKIFDDVIKQIELNTHENKNNKILQKALISMIKEEKNIAKKHFEKIDVNSLSKKQKEDFEFLKLYVNQGEFITSEIELNLFE